MSGTTAIKRPAEGDLINPPKRLKEASEIEVRVNQFKEILKNLSCSSAQDFEYGRVLFTYISSHQLAEETCEGLFSALELTNKELKFKEGKSVSLPPCLWRVHSLYFFNLFNSKMIVAPLEDESSIEILESFKLCLSTCASTSILNRANWQELFSLAQKYQVLWLVKDCENFLCENFSEISEEDRLKLLCFAAEFCLSKLMRTCLIHFVREQIQVTDLKLLKVMNEIAEKFELPDLKLYLSDGLERCLSVGSSNILTLQLNDEEIESKKEEIKKCISVKNSWHNPQMRLLIENECCQQAGNLAYLLEENTTFIKLDLVMDGKGIQIILERIKKNQTLKHLEICSPQAPNDSLGGEALVLLFNTLEENFYLESLTLTSCIFDRQSASALQKYLINNPYLESFAISDTNLDKETILALQKGCSANTQLTDLSLMKCYITEEASLSVFFTSLEGNKTLAELNVGNPYNSDRVEDNPLPMLLEMLKKNKSLKKLAIDSLEDFDIEALLKIVLSEECSVEQISFSNSKLKKIETVISIFESVRKNSKKIFFEDCTMGKIAYAQFLVEQKTKPPTPIIFLNDINIEIFSEEESESYSDAD